MTGLNNGKNILKSVFTVYLNEFESYISTLMMGFLVWPPRCESFMNLYCLLYADDTIILAETPHQLQSALDAVGEYCQKWQLSVNTKKTNIVGVFLEVK